MSAHYSVPLPRPGKCDSDVMIKKIFILNAILFTCLVSGVSGYLLGYRRIAPHPAPLIEETDDLAKVDLILMETMAQVSIMQGMVTTLEIGDIDKARRFALMQLRTHELTISSFLKSYPDMSHSVQALETIQRLRQFLSTRSTDSQKQGRQIFDAIREPSEN